MSIPSDLDPASSLLGQYDEPLTDPSLEAPSLWNRIWRPFSLLPQKTQALYEYVYPKAKTLTELTGTVLSVTGRTAFKAYLCLDEMITGFKPVDPQQSIDESLTRLQPCPEKFVTCCVFLADQAAALYLENADRIKEKLTEHIQDFPLDFEISEEEGFIPPDFSDMLKMSFFDQAGSWTAWFMDLNKDLIANTIKANLLNILANLSIKAFSAPFPDGNQNPYGRLLSLLGGVIDSYQVHLTELDQLDGEEYQKKAQQVFKQLSEDLLALALPRKEKDIKLFHPLIPVVLFQNESWNQLTQRLPQLLQKIYEQTRPVAQDHPNWLTQFDQALQITNSQAVCKAPSLLLDYFIVKKEGRPIRNLQPLLDEWMESKGIAAHRLLSTEFVKYLSELLLTQDPRLMKMGRFLERYVMERLLFNALQSVPVEENREEGNLLERDPTQHANLFIEISNQMASHLSGINQPDGSEAFAQGSLALLGLNRSDTFPLPDLIKQHVWPFIEDFQKTQLPALLDQEMSKLSDFLKILNSREDNKAVLDQAIGDTLLTEKIAAFIHLWAAQAFDKLAAATVEKQLNEWLPLEQQLTDEKQQEIRLLWLKLLHPENQAGRQARELVGHYGEGLIFYFLTNLYCTYQEANGISEVNGAIAGGQPLPFAPWLIEQLSLACNQLMPDSLTDIQIDALKQLVELRKKTAFAEDGQEKLQAQAAIDQLWPIVQPGFTALTSHLLTLLGCKEQEQFPLPEALQAPVWNALQHGLPKLLFEHTAEMLLPILEKKSNQHYLITLPQGEKIARGCRLLTESILSALPDWIESYREVAEGINRDALGGVLSTAEVDQLAEKIKALSLANDIKSHTLLQTCETFFQNGMPYTAEGKEGMLQKLRPYKQKLLLLTAAPEELIEQIGLQGVLEETKRLMANQVRSFIHQPQEFASAWALINNYIEGMLLKAAVQLGKVDRQIFEAAKRLALDAESALKEKTVEEATPILELFVDQLFSLLQVDNPQNLFGIPLGLREALIKEVKVKTAQIFLGTYQTIREISHRPPLLEREDGRISNVSQAALALTRYALDEGFEQISRPVNGEPAGIQAVYRVAGPLLNIQAQQEGPGLASLLQEVMEQQLPTPLIKQGLDLLKAPEIDVYKQQLAEFINPFIVEKVMIGLTPLLTIEEQEGRKFDQALISALLPLLTRHLGYLNNMAKKGEALTVASFANEAGGSLHPAFSASESEEARNHQKEEKFYKNQVKKILQFVCPNGKQDLILFIPNLPQAILQPVWQAIKKTLITALPQVMPLLFDEDGLRAILTEVLEKIVADLKAPIEPDVQTEEFINEEEEERYREIDSMMGEFVAEAARFLELPVDRLSNYPNWLKKLLGFEAIQAQALGAIGKAVRKQLNGKLISQIINQALLALAQKKSKLLTDEEKLEARQAEKEHLNDLDNQLVREGLWHVARLIGSRIDHAFDGFQSPFIQTIKSAVLKACAFIIMRCIVAPLRLFRVDLILLSFLVPVVRRTRLAVFEKLKQGDLHEDLIFQGIEAFEQVLESRRI